MESRGQWKWQQRRMDWLTHCEAIAESDAFALSGHPEDHGFILKAKLLRAAVRGENWREIYRSILRPVADSASTLSRLQHDGGSDIAISLTLERNVIAFLLTYQEGPDYED